ncbi:MAG: KEOPS complex subunit Pcc1 [Methanothrix sp.]|nr:KEOPS complex subunit Pcc1 [Methanothrix sp.]
MIHARLVFHGPLAGVVARSIEPDNLPNMRLSLEEGSFRLEFSAEKAGTLLSTLDDLLMNVKIAEETFVSLEDR